MVLSSKLFFFCGQYSLVQRVGSHDYAFLRKSLFKLNGDFMQFNHTKEMYDLKTTV